MVLTPERTLKDTLSGIYKSYLNPVRRMDEMASFSSWDGRSIEAASHDIVPQYSLQKIFRPLFGKGPAVKPSIGGHPDFDHLAGTKRQEKSPIVTLFMDIESSTRLGILYSPEDVQRIKNAFICIAIEIAKTFDGHIHRIMGDAVMVFFGSKKHKTENAVIDALNCAAILNYLVERIIIPQLDAEGYKDSFGIRIGIDYGSRENVLWSAYGYPGMEEVTATSFFVDVAAKLQHSAGRNQIMLGQSLLEHVDFPTLFTTNKTEIRGGEETPVLYLQPNHSNRDGKKVNYIQKVFLWEDYLYTTVLGQKDSAATGMTGNRGTDRITIRAEEYDKDKKNCFGIYGACTRILSKDRSIKFTIDIEGGQSYPLYVACSVTNNGNEAQKAEDMGHNRETEIIRIPQDGRGMTKWEQTAYRGLHFFNVDVKTNYGTKYKSSFGVYIE